MTIPDDDSDRKGRGGAVLPGSALSYPATRSTVRRKLRLVLIGLVTGVSAFVAFVFVVGYISDENDQLRNGGGTAVGTVTELIQDARNTEGRASVTFSAEGVSFVGHVDLGADSSDYHEGENVDVYYDVHNPSRMTINDEDNQPGWTVLPTIVLFLVGVVATPAFLWMTCSWLQTRRILRMSPWRAVHCSISLNSRNHVVVQTHVDGRPHRLESRPIGSPRRVVRPKSVRWSSGTLWLAGPVGPRAILARPDGTDLLRLRSPRTRRRGRRGGLTR